MSADTDAQSEIVLVPSTNGGGQSRPFHTRECRYVRNFGDSMQEWTRDMAEGWGFEECCRCAGRADQ